MGNRLIFAIRRGDASEVRELLRSGGYNVDLRDESGLTPLMHAATASNTAVLEAFLDGGASVNAADQGRRYTPLHFAVQKARADIVRVLLAHGADPNAQDVFGNTPLMEAVTSRSGGSEIVELLLEAGGDPQIENKHGVSPKHYLGVPRGGVESEIASGELFFEHPSGEFATAREALRAAFEKLLAMKGPTPRLVFVAQGQGSREDSYDIAEVEYEGDSLILELTLDNLKRVAAAAGIAEDDVHLEGDGVDVSRLGAEERARLLDAIFRLQCEIHPFSGDDYPVGAEWR